MARKMTGYVWIKMLKDGPYKAKKGDVLELSAPQAEQLIDDEFAVVTDDPTATKFSARKTNNKAMSAKA